MDSIILQILLYLKLILKMSIQRNENKSVDNFIVVKYQIKIRKYLKFEELKYETGDNIKIVKNAPLKIN